MTARQALPVSARRVRISTTVTAWVHVFMAALTLVVAGGIAATQATRLEPRLGAAAWYVVLGIVGAVLIGTIAMALFRVRDAEAPEARRIKRNAVMAYWALLGLIAAAAAGLAAGATEGWMVMIPAVNVFILAMSAMWYLKEKARGA